MWTKGVLTGEGKSDAKLPSGVKVVLTGVEVVDADGAMGNHSGVVKAIVSAIERSGIKVELPNGKAGDHSNSGKAEYPDAKKQEDAKGEMTTGAKKQEDAKGELTTGAKKGEDAKGELPTGAKKGEDAKVELPTGAKKGEDAKGELPTGAKKQEDAKGELPTGVKARREVSPSEAEALHAASAGLRAILSDGDAKAKNPGGYFPTKVAIYVHTDSKPDLFVYYDEDEYDKLMDVDVNDPLALKEAAAAFDAVARGINLDYDKLTGAMRMLELYNEGYNNRRAQTFQGALQREILHLEADLREEIQQIEKSLRGDLAHDEKLAAIEIACAKRCVTLAEKDPEQAAVYAAAVCALIEAQQSRYYFSAPRSRLPNKQLVMSAGPVARTVKKIIDSPQAKRLAHEVQVFLKGEGKEATAEEILKVLESNPRFAQAQAMERAAKRQLWKDLEEDFYRLIKFGGTLSAGVALISKWEMNMDETPEHQESFFE